MSRIRGRFERKDDAVDDGKAEERIWNSLDGVMDFGVVCEYGGGLADENGDSGGLGDSIRA